MSEIKELQEIIEKHSKTLAKQEVEFSYYKKSLDSIVDLVKEIKSDIKNGIKELQDKHSQDKEKIWIELRSHEKNISSFLLVRKIVYGAVSVILISFMGVIIGFVISK